MPGKWLMPISEKTRKILWGRSGNRCAMCRQQLVVDPTETDSESVVGDECHIISGAKNGPRYDPTFPPENLDEVSNLILLCRVHHKMVDDQRETYTAEILRSIKANHEHWVEEKLRDKPQIPPVQIKRIKSEIPTHLPAIVSGKELFNLAMDCHGSYQNYSDDLDDEETDLIGRFFQTISDRMDLSDVLEPIERVHAAKSLDDDIKSLRSRGFRVFAAVENQRLEGGVSAPSVLRFLHLWVVRETDPSIVTNQHEKT